MKIKTLLAFVFVFCILSACNSTPDYYYAFKSSSNGKWGMISPQGKVLFDSEFKMQPTDVIGGVFFVQTGKDDKWQIYDAIDNTTSRSDDSYEFILPFNEDVTLAVKKKDYIKIIDKQGNEIAPLVKAGSDTIYTATAFHDGLSIILTKNGFGAVNTKGEVVVKPKYAFLFPFSDQVSIGMDNKYMDEDEDEENRMISVIDTKGETLFTFKATKYYDLAEIGFHKGLLAVCKKDGKELRWGFINKAGEEVVKPTAKNAQIGEWNDVLYVFSDGEQWGLKKFNNDEVLIRCKYDKLEFADADGSLLWAGEKNNSDFKWSLVNRKGDLISKETYKDHMKFNGNYCPVQISDNEWGFINKKGEEQKLNVDINTLGGCSMDLAIANPTLDVNDLSDLIESELREIINESIDKCSSDLSERFNDLEMFSMAAMFGSEDKVDDEDNDIFESREMDEPETYSYSLEGYMTDGQKKYNIEMSLEISPHIEYGDLLSGFYHYSSQPADRKIFLSGKEEQESPSDLKTYVLISEKESERFVLTLDGKSMYGNWYKYDDVTDCEAGNDNYSKKLEVYLDF